MNTLFVAPPADGPTARAELLRRARVAGLNLLDAEARLDESGLDFLALHATDAEGLPWIVRAPRRPSVVAACAVERRALDLVRPSLTVAVPHWRICTPQIVAYPRLPGVPAWSYGGEAGLLWALPDPSAPPLGLLHDLADVVAGLRSATAGAAAAELPCHTVDAIRATLADQLAKVAAAFALPASVETAWRRFIVEAAWPVQPALVHGDLHPGHLLLDDTHRLLGVLDWTEAAVDDPTLDLASFRLCFGADALAGILARLAQRGWPEAPSLRTHIEARADLVPLLMLHWALVHGSEVSVGPALAMVAEQAERAERG